ncbi:MAG TPA: hypothetical protein VK815_15600 [Candidatus Acidoferrales bacterium]|jgi:hypothetical protein|nr:hypothetical protein [Candidatus Acidoferrales bacterium]
MKTIPRYLVAILFTAGIGLFAWAYFSKPLEADSKLVAQLTAQELYKAIGGGVMLLAGLQFWLTTWLKARIEESIKHEYAMKLEDYKNDIKIREQASKVAALLANVRWNDGKSNQELDRMAWELSLWLPTDLCCRLTEVLVRGQSVGELKQILIDVRKLLLKEQAGDLKPEQIAHVN